MLLCEETASVLEILKPKAQLVSEACTSEYAALLHGLQPKTVFSRSKPQLTHPYSLSRSFSDWLKKKKMINIYLLFQSFCIKNEASLNKFYNRLSKHFLHCILYFFFF